MDFSDFHFLFEQSARRRPRVAISACLTGAAVRYDGTDKYQPGVDRWLREQIELIPLCPELDAGLGVPRPPVQLVDTSSGLRARGRDQPTLDVTEALQRTALRHCAALQAQPLCGYLWKSRSPSCGLHSTPIFDARGVERGTGSGLQARHIATALPWLVMAEEGVLQEERLAWRFVLGCRLVDDCLYAGTTTAAIAADHYRALLAGVERTPAQTSALQGIAALLVHAAMTLPEATLRRHLRRS